MSPLRLLVVVGLALTVTVGVSAAKGQKVRVAKPHLMVQHKEFELQVDDEVKVRRQDPPIQYDDKGKLRKPTAEELKEFKGPDPKLPGYSAEYADLKNGQVVKVTLSKRKDDSTKKAVTDTSDKDDKDSQKPRRAKVAELEGQLSLPNNKDGGKDKNGKGKQGSDRKIVLRVDYTALQAGKYAGHTDGQKEVIDSAYVTMIVIRKDKDDSKTK